MKSPLPRPPQFTLKVSRTTTGFGLFAKENIPANRFVIEYWGELVKTDFANTIGGRYLYDLENGKTILGGTRKNIARYINHGCRPNCESRPVGNKVFIFSIKPIKAGEELVYDYGKEYFDAYIKPNGCGCSYHKKKRQNKKSRQSE